MPDKEEVIAAAVELIDAFARNDRKRYFAAFTPDATFIFHGTAEVLDSRAAYEAEWENWIKDMKFHVKDCISSHRVVKLIGNVAVFKHQTETHVSTKEGEDSYHERETIIFHKIGGKWLGVHEHLSPMPG